MLHCGDSIPRSRTEVSIGNCTQRTGNRLRTHLHHNSTTTFARLRASWSHPQNISLQKNSFKLDIMMYRLSPISSILRVCHKYESTYILYTLNPVSGGSGSRRWGRLPPRNECELCHAVGQSGLGVPAFKYWRLYSPASPFTSTLLPVSNLNPSSWTLSPYLKPQCHLLLCIGALPAWAAQPVAMAAASRLFSMTTNRLPCTTRAAVTATSPCAGSRPSPFS
jgi:hypothetical protein